MIFFPKPIKTYGKLCGCPIDLFPLKLPVAPKGPFPPTGRQNLITTAIFIVVMATSKNAFTYHLLGNYGKL